MEAVSNVAIGLSESERDLLQRVLHAPNTISSHEVAHLTTLRNQIVHGAKAWTIVDPAHIYPTQFICGSAQLSTAVTTVKPFEVDLLACCYVVSAASAPAEIERGRRGFRGFQRLRRSGEFTLNPRKQWRKIVRRLNRLIAQFIRLLDYTKSLTDFVVRLRPFHLIHGAHPPDVTAPLSFSFSA